MANKDLKEKEAMRQENIDATVSKTEQFYNENKKTIWTVLAVIAVIGLGILAYSKFIYQPKCAEAMKAMCPAEQSFNAGEFDLALNGDGNVAGFNQVIDDYGAKAGEAVYLYAGICELQLGNYDNAIKDLRKYKGKEPILAARAKACIGDAHVGLGNYEAAAKSYGEAASYKNDFAAGYLLKEGLVYEKLGNNAKALDCYNAVKTDYPRSIEAYDIEKYINRIAE